MCRRAARDTCFHHLLTFFCQELRFRLRLYCSVQQTPIIASTGDVTPVYQLAVLSLVASVFSQS